MIKHTAFIFSFVVVACSGLFFGIKDANAGFINVAFDGTTVTGNLVITAGDLPANCSVNIFSYGNPITDNSGNTILTTVSNGYYNSTYPFSYTPTSTNAITITPWNASCYDLGGFWFDLPIQLDATPINSAMAVTVTPTPTLHLTSPIVKTTYTGQIGYIQFKVGDIPQSPFNDPLHPTTGVVIVAVDAGNQCYTEIGSYTCLTANCAVESANVLIYNAYTPSNLFDVIGNHGGNNFCDLATSSTYKIAYIYPEINGGGGQTDIGQYTISDGITNYMDTSMEKITTTMTEFIKLLYRDFWPFILAFAIVASVSAFIGKALTNFIK